MVYLTALVILALSLGLLFFIAQYYRVSNLLSHHQTQKKTLDALWKIEQIIVNSLNFQEVAQKISDSVLLELGKFGFAIIVLILVDDESKSLKRISISRTQEANTALEISPVPFNNISIPLSATENNCVRSVNENKVLTTAHMANVLVPAIDRNFVEKVQKTLGVKTTITVPVSSKNKILGCLIFSVKKSEKDVSTYEWDIIHGYADAVGIALDNSLLYTDLQTTTKKLDEANKHLQELDKLKDEFVSLASHELRTPMTAIKSYVWMVQNHKAGDITDTAQKYLAIVYSSTERLIHLVNDMLDISRIESGRFQLHPAPFKFADLVHEIQTEFLAKAGERHMNWQTSIDPPDTTVTADRDKIEQVLENLVGNAFKFTGDGGTVTLKAFIKDNNLAVAISDTGRGIAKEDMSKLFTKFGRLGEGLPTLSQPGTGLGLYLSKQFIELHHGHVTVDSALGRGSTFTFTLPLG